MSVSSFKWTRWVFIIDRRENFTFTLPLNRGAREIIRERSNFEENFYREVYLTGVKYVCPINMSFLECLCFVFIIDRRENFTLLNTEKNRQSDFVKSR